MVRTWTAKIYTPCGKFYTQVVLVYLKPFWHNSLLKCVSQHKIAKKSLKPAIWGVKGHSRSSSRCWYQLLNDWPWRINQSQCHFCMVQLSGSASFPLSSIRYVPSRPAYIVFRKSQDNTNTWAMRASERWLIS